MKILFPNTFYAATSPACGRGRLILPTKSSKYIKKRQSLLRRGPLVCLRPVYKPHSVQRNCFRLCSHLSGRCVAAPLDAAYPGLTQPPRDWIHMKTSRLPPSADGFVPAWPCSRRGLPDDLHYCKRRWSLTPPFHHHPAQARGCLFLWPFSGRFAPYGGFPAPGTIRRRALWSADFPRWRQRATAIARPT